MTAADLTFVDIQHLILVKLCLVVFIISGFVCLYYKIKPWIFLLITGACLAAGFYFFIDGLRLPFWGLTGDEVTVAAMYNTFAHGGWFSDFAYHSLPPFYPPLWFWLFAVWGKIFGLNGIVLAKLSVFCAYLILPIGLYLIQRLYWRQSDAPAKPGVIAAFLAPLLLLVFIDHDAFISKPYEVLTAALAVLWAAFLLLEVSADRWNWKKYLVFGVAGGILFMAYYLWLVFAGLAMALAGLTVKKDRQIAYYLRLAAVAAITAIVSLPYLGPLVYSYITLGTENWQVAFFLPSGLQGNFYLFSLISWKNILMVAGAGTLIYCRKNKYLQSLLFLFAAIYAWWLMGLLTLLLAAAPFQEFKGFMFFERAILAFALAYGLERIWLWAGEKYKSSAWRPAVLSLGVLFLGANLFFGTFIDQPEVQQRLVESKKMRPEVAPLVEFLRQDIANRDKLTLQSGINEITAFVPVNSFIYFNQNNSHPAANFSQRFYYLKTMAAAGDADEFHQLCNDTPFGSIDRLILFRQDGRYYLFFNFNEMIKGIKEEAIAFSEELISYKYFDKIYDQNGFVVWLKK